MKVLVACEESQAVCKAFREKGHEAYSCDIIECSGGHPEWHIQGDVLEILNLKNVPVENGYFSAISFKTCDGKHHNLFKKWDMIIAFPPCTHLAVSGARHFEKKRADGRQKEAIEFFCQFLKADCEKIAIENPIGIISGDYISKWFPDLAEKYNLPKKQSQIIQPYEYGHNAKKSTCLWLKGLPLLKPTEIVEPDLVSYTCKSGKKVTFSRHMVQGFENGERAKSRSKTFEGVAKAMAEQWG
ncbi:MAG: DNA cytosine methyltransferase [Clostridia bacterium]|nr:DNA cytosine methyltransferase [Clostridia bacterium]